MYSIPSHISDKAATDNEDWLLSVDAKLSHRVNNRKQSLHALGLFANHGLVNLESDAVMIKVLLHLIAVQVENIQVHDGEAAPPGLVALSQLHVGNVEDAIEELEVIFNLFVAAD